MPSTFFGLNIALRGLMASRTALDVTAHNVANASTEGYTRQDAVMKATAPYTEPTAGRYVGAGQLGTGVEISTIRRIRDSFLDYQLRLGTSSLGNGETMRSTMEDVEEIFAEPSDTSIAALMGKMWAAWQDLSADPGSYAAKSAVVQSSTVVADALRDSAGQLSRLREQVVDNIELRAIQVNSWLREVASVNDQIVRVQAVGDEPNDLRDSRDLLLDSLSKVLRISYEEQADGSVNVWLGSDRTRALVEGINSHSLGDSAEPLTAAEEALVEDGELRALLDCRDGVLDANRAGSVANRLDALASALIQQVNALHGTTPFFSGTEASDIALNSALVSNPELVRAGASGEAGDGGVALEIARLQSSEVTIDGQATTLGEWYRSLVTRLGIDVQQSKAIASQRQLRVDQLKTDREALSGVSLDEEAANMIRFERAYQASARVMTAMDEMLDTLINGMGIVGR